jgi:hypothetical protein
MKFPVLVFGTILQMLEYFAIEDFMQKYQTNPLIILFGTVFRVAPKTLFTKKQFILIYFLYIFLNHFKELISKINFKIK